MSDVNKERLMAHLAQRAVKILSQEDLRDLTYPAAYVATRTDSTETGTVTYLRNLIKVDDSTYITFMTATINTHTATYMVHKTEAVAFEMLQGYEVKPADLQFKARTEEDRQV